MNIAFLCYPYHRGGVTRRMADLAIKIRRQGSTCWFIAPQPRSPFVNGRGRPTMVDLSRPHHRASAQLAYYHIAPTANIWIALSELLGALLFSFGFSALLGAINAKWRYVQHAVPFMLQVGLFITPVIYQNSFVPAR